MCVHWVCVCTECQCISKASELHPWWQYWEKVGTQEFGSTLDKERPE